MGDRIILRAVQLGLAHVPTGNTRHYGGQYGQLLPHPVSLQIATHSGGGGVYLFYLDEHGNEQTDTWHQTLEDAMDQADFEFNVKADEWEVANEEAG